MHFLCIKALSITLNSFKVQPVVDAGATPGTEPCLDYSHTPSTSVFRGLDASNIPKYIMYFKILLSH